MVKERDEESQLLAFTKGEEGL